MAYLRCGDHTKPRKDAPLSKVPSIAIIDDDASVRRSTSSLVRSYGYLAHTFASAEDFLESERMDHTSCVISDVRMPDMSGIELQSHLLSRGYRIPFIFMTAFLDETNVARAMKAGAICFLTKPFNGSSLIAYLDSAVRFGGGSGV
jgi:FixJ family two-component response regulator